MMHFGMAFHLAGVDIRRDSEIAERKRMKLIWSMILQRCNNPRSQAYRHYGGRGIKCTISSFAEFFAHMGERPTPGHSVDRIDVNGDYAIGNLRWATSSENNANRRDAAYVEIEGKRYRRHALAVKYGVTGDRIDYRARTGKPFEVVVSKAPMWDTSSLPRAVAASMEKKKNQKVCKRGHELSGDNLYLHKGRRHCRACRRQWRPI